MAKVELIGDREILNGLKDLERGVGYKGIRAAARKAAKPILTTARRELKNTPTRERKTENGFSKLEYIAKNTKIKTIRDKINPGVLVTVSGRDLPVGERFWSVKGYAHLLAFGSKQRKTRSSGANRGSVRGFGDWIVKAAKMKQRSSLITFKKLLGTEVSKALNRAFR